jgi:nucleotidyltransferase substrate binding protein (TIGR01987 family)
LPVVVRAFTMNLNGIWKALKLYLQHQGIIVKTPRDSLVEAFRIGLIDDEKIFLDMLEDKNNTSHIYDEETSEKIFSRIKKNYQAEITKVIELLDTSLKNYLL